MKKFILIFALLISCSSVSKAQCDTEFREACGNASAMAVYNTYMLIGEVGDAYKRYAYNRDEVTAKMKTQTATLQTLINTFSKCRPTAGNGLNKDDMQYIKELLRCLESLRLTAETLSNYVKDRNDASELAYNLSRLQAWTQISALLGLEEK